MHRVSSTVSHLAVIALAVIALCIGTVVWLWELASQSASSAGLFDEAYADDNLQNPEMENAQTSAAD
jgi:hypothetical protein